ncbi:hypothetical protein MLD38_038634 [Melastoma candidum]|uniref:Uncharacterized protein n=2 Tax=Melastoma candidum TaxID=119954 RepID=A0ACB9L111_9MYRT|nr:hypothetical protein MLD38_038634 [Melastoma candidum]
MPPTDYQGSFLGRISIRRNQVASMDSEDLEDLDIFQRNISDRFTDLLPDSPSSDSPFLSVAWLRKLLDVYLCCEAEFKAVLATGHDITKPPVDRLLPDLLDRCLKSLDICNAVIHGIDTLRHATSLASIAAESLSRRPLSDGHVRRARKALVALLAVLAAEEKEPSSAGAHRTTERNWSFGRRGGGSGGRATSGAAVGLPKPWGVGKNWSAAKQVQAMSANLVAPRGAESAGIAVPVHVMSAVVVFVMWTMVAAIPCQERSGLATTLQLPKQVVWAQGMTGLVEKIGEEWKRKEKKGGAGLMEELHKLEKVGQSLAEFAEGYKYPGEEEKVEEAGRQAEEMGEICRRMEEGLAPLQQQIREVFHRIVRSRADMLEASDHAAKVSAPSSM